MKINYKFLPIKGHYFFFLGSISPVLPFMVVVARQLGIPIYLQGIIQATILLVTVVIKPLIAAIADIFSRRRKAIFISILSLMLGTLFFIGYLSPMHEIKEISINGSLVLYNESVPSFNDDVESSNEKPYSQSPRFFSFEPNSCFAEELWDCRAISTDGSLVQASRLRLEQPVDNSDSSTKLYFLENIEGFIENRSVIIFNCKGGIYQGPTCQSLWRNPFFYLYLVLLTVGNVCFATANSITDAICMDLIGEKGNFGSHRAWGTIGWGLMGPISGLLVDHMSGSDFMKDYTPAFMMLLVMGSIDILLSVSQLKVPKFRSEVKLLHSVKPLLKNPEFLVFLFFVILAGSFDGVVISYIFVLQEEMAKDAAYFRTMKFVQGLTLGVQCAVEAPFMFVCGWFLKKMGASKVLSLVFFLYIIRILGLALVGSFGPIWATLVTELLNGPCYGLGYTAVVVQAGQLTPPGASTTVQSITNICYESIGYALASLLGGVLHSLMGSSGIYYTFGGLSVVTFFLHLFSISWLNKLKGEESNAEIEYSNG